jgi:type II secretory pathway pseudopilin PulG
MSMNKSYQLPVTSCQWTRRSRRARCLATGNWQLATAFTVTELLVVIGIIVLVLALAVPAFNFLTGSRSTEAAMNTISAFLGRARTEAIGLQEIRGVLFYIDPKTTNVAMVLVREVPPNQPPAGLTPPDIFLDVTADGEALTLPKGVSIQFVDDDTTAGNDDRYIGFNNEKYRPGGSIQTPYGGVILFDGRGQLVSRTFGFQTHRFNTALGADQYTAMGTLLFTQLQPTDVYASSFDDVWPVNPALTTALKSSIGFVLFDNEPFRGQFPDPMGSIDPQVAGGGYAAPEPAEERWLDENAVPILINRYNGTLVKGE